MFTDCVRCFRFNIKLLRGKFASLDAAHLDAAPVDGLKAPRWVLGHLAEGHFYLVNLLGLADQHPFPDDWMKAFAPGTPSLRPYGLDDNADMPPADGLLDYINATEQPIVDAASSVAPGSYGDPHGIDFLYSTGIETQADLIAHLLASHYAFHLGQMSIWERMNGQSPAF